MMAKLQILDLEPQFKAKLDADWDAFLQKLIKDFHMNENQISIVNSGYKNSKENLFLQMEAYIMPEIKNLPTPASPSPETLLALFDQAILSSREYHLLKYNSENKIKEQNT